LIASHAGDFAVDGILAADVDIGINAHRTVD
jgi:hypothetical protein